MVGGGISGLAAARFFHQAAGKTARVLILENHDDFGGHAKRNEFQVDKTFMLGYGGTSSIESPAPYSAVAKGVIRDLGIDVSSYARHNDDELYPSLGIKQKIFFDQETFGTDQLVIDPTDQTRVKRCGSSSPPRLRCRKSQGGYEASLCAEEDLMPGLSSQQKKAKLARISYADYLTNLVKVEPQVVKVLDSEPKPLYGAGIDAVSAQDAWGLGLPGFDGLKLTPEPGSGHGPRRHSQRRSGKIFFPFPRWQFLDRSLLVRSLVPEAVPGNSAKIL